MAHGGLLMRETVNGIIINELPLGSERWSCNAQNTFVIQGRPTGVRKWLEDRSYYTIKSIEGPLFIQMRQAAEDLGAQLRSAYAGAVLGGTGLGVASAPATVAVMAAELMTDMHSAVGPAIGVGSTAADTAADLMGFPDRIPPYRFARLLDKLGLRSKIRVYMTALSPHYPPTKLPSSFVQLTGGLDHSFLKIRREIEDLHC